MAQAERAQLYQELKAAGYSFGKHYREYTQQELEKIKDKVSQEIRERTGIAVAPKDETELPTQRRGQEGVPIRTDLEGNIWFQEEILKSGSPKPRGYKVHRERGATLKEVTIDSGDGYTETFEVGEASERPFEARVGTPTWQVGKYRTPNLPFMIYVCRDVRGYDREEVENYFGGKDVLPENVVTIYVGNHLCYDIRSVNTAIQREHNMLLRKGAVV